MCSNLSFAKSHSAVFFITATKNIKKKQVASVDTQELPESSPILGKQVGWFLTSNATSLTFLF